MTMTGLLDRGKVSGDCGVVNGGILAVTCVVRLSTGPTFSIRCLSSELVP